VVGWLWAHAACITFDDLSSVCWAATWLSFFAFFKNARAGRTEWDARTSANATSDTPRNVTKSTARALAKRATLALPATPVGDATSFLINIVFPNSTLSRCLWRFLQSALKARTAWLARSSAGVRTESSAIQSQALASVTVPLDTAARTAIKVVACVKSVDSFYLKRKLFQQLLPRARPRVAV